MRPKSTDHLVNGAPLQRSGGAGGRVHGIRVHGIRVHGVRVHGGRSSQRRHAVDAATEEEASVLFGRVTIRSYLE